MTQREEEKYYEEARKFTWDHFDLHSKHRLEMFKSHVTFVGLVYAGYGAGFRKAVKPISFESEDTFVPTERSGYTH